MVKIPFSLILISFLFPFVLLTCNDKKTREIKPLVMQDQLMYPIQGYKIILGSIDKDDEIYKSLGMGGNSPFSMFDEEEPIDREYRGEDDFVGKDKKSSKKSHRLWQVLLGLVFLSSLAGLIISFIGKKNSSTDIALKALTWFGFAIVVFFTLAVFYEESKFNNKLTGGLGMGLGEIETSFGFGTGYYICFFSFLTLIFYFHYFNRYYRVRIDKIPKIVYGYDDYGNKIPIGVTADPSSDQTQEGHRL